MFIDPEKIQSLNDPFLFYCTYVRMALAVFLYVRLYVFVYACVSLCMGVLYVCMSIDAVYYPIIFVSVCSLSYIRNTIR